VIIEGFSDWAVSSGVRLPEPAPGAGIAPTGSLFGGGQQTVAPMGVPNRGVVNTEFAQSRRGPLRPGRTFDDGAGREWRVTEHVAASGRSLVFMSASAMRRVSNYPDDWWLLPERELEALSWGR
jgi:hypothetical protein